MNNVINNVVGQFKDKVFDVNTGELLYETDWSKNTIVNGLNRAIAYAFAGMGGISYWAVGSGSDSWDLQNPPTAQATDTGCVNEIGRKAIQASDIKFIDSDNRESSSVTNRIQITVTFTENECNGVWREFAIFGGNATTTLKSGIAINHKNHATMVKTNSMVVERQIRFTFN